METKDGLNRKESVLWRYKSLGLPGRSEGVRSNTKSFFTREPKIESHYDFHYNFPETMDGSTESEVRVVVT